MADPGSPTLAENARRCGGYRWMEHRLFLATGAWAPVAGIGAVTVFLDRLSAEHAWHAQLWVERLPVLAGADPEALTVAPSPAVAASFAAFEALGSAAGDRAGVLDQLAGLARVMLPRLAVTYAGQAAVASAVADGAVLRALTLAGRDLAEAWAGAERLLQGLLADEAEVEAAAAVVARLEAPLAGTAPGAGGFG